jgi:hypothetical protein
MCAGSVMHALHDELDIRKMGGLRNKLRFTYFAFLVGVLAIIGFRASVLQQGGCHRRGIHPCLVWRFLAGFVWALTISRPA